MASDAEDRAMRWAIALASRSLGATSPNPIVGCVLVIVGPRISRRVAARRVVHTGDMFATHSCTSPRCS